MTEQDESGRDGRNLDDRVLSVDDALDTGELAESGRETVGRADAQADAIRSGADVDVEPVGPEGRDSDGVPVGQDDAIEDARRTGALDEG